MVLVVGDAGVGKTRFAEEGMRLAAAGGVVPVWGGCLPLAEKLPLLPVAEALGDLGRLEGGTLLEAALVMVPPYVRVEVGRLLPQLAPGGVPADGRGEGWRRERLFAGVADLLGVVARWCGLALVIEDVHWADSATLDCLTFLARVGDGGPATVVVTCRSDEVPLDAQVAGWLAQARGNGETEEIRLGPLSRKEVAEEIAALVGGPAPGWLVEDVYARAEGNPFFTEQLVAAAQEQAPDGMPRAPAGLPARLAELLAARAGRCGGDARAVLHALAVARRPLTEDLLGGIIRSDVDAVRGALRELGSARLLAENTPEGAYRLRHALLAEAVASGLLSGERAALHERTARSLQAAGDQTLAAEAAGHWAAAGRAAEELPARVAAAGAAERVFGYAEAAAHWQRAIELSQELPGAAREAGVDVPLMYLHAIDALDVAGAGQQAGAVAEEAYRQFAGHPDPATAAIVQMRAAYYRAMSNPEAGLPLIKEALRVFEQQPPSAEHAEAWLHYGTIFLFHAEGRLEASRHAVNRALEIAEAAGATALLPRILAHVAAQAFMHGQIGEGFAILDCGRALAEATGEESAVWVDAIESLVLLKTGKFQAAADVARRGLRAARQVGRHASFYASLLPGNASEALLALGRTAEAAALIDPLTAGPPDREHWVAHLARMEVDLLRGDIEAAATRGQQIHALISRYFSIDFAREAAQRAAELALWAGRPDDALQEIQRVLALFQFSDLTFVCGRPLAVGMRACADLAERAQARRDHHAAGAALAAAGDLTSWVDRMGGVPFTHHPLMAAIPADRATWDAERTRLAGASDPAAWSAAAKTWEELGCPHRAGYAWWRCAEARLAGGQPATVATPALRTAAAAAEGHAPLLAQIHSLAQRARISLQTARAASSETARPAEAPAPYGLTERELAVLRLLTAGRTNTQIGAELYISPRTAGVHVTNILRKLGVSNRVQAAALAERAGLRHPSTAKHCAPESKDPPAAGRHDRQIRSLLP
jgi:DNA-binding CsgD family transcriptional regulator/tetratricopeptide (TPR) repeat protein